MQLDYVEPGASPQQLSDGSDPQVVELARAIIDGQTGEIQTMRELAGQL